MRIQMEMVLMVIGIARDKDEEEGEDGGDENEYIGMREV